MCAANGQHRLLTDFEFLGAAIGTGACLASHTSSRSAAAGKLSDAIAQMEGPQVGVWLLCHSAAFSRLVHSMRCVPPTAQQAALATCDSKVHECLVQLTGLPLGQTSLQQVARGLSWAGLGLRSTARHAAGAYLGGCLCPNHWRLGPSLQLAPCSRPGRGAPALQWGQRPGPHQGCSPRIDAEKIVAPAGLCFMGLAG